MTCNRAALPVCALLIAITGCNVDGLNINHQRAQRATSRMSTANPSDLPDVSIVDAPEVDIVESVISHRSKYKKSLNALSAYYAEHGYYHKQKWAEAELADLQRVKPFKYILSAEVPMNSLRPSHNIAEADVMYARGLALMKEGGHGMPVVYREDKMRQALNLMTELITKYPNSDKIDDAAYCCGVIYKEYFRDQELLSVRWFERCRQWDPQSPHPALFQAAVVYDYRMHDRAKALELYHRVLEEEEANRSNSAFAVRRIQELTNGVDKLVPPTGSNRQVVTPRPMPSKRPSSRQSISRPSATTRYNSSGNSSQSYSSQNYSSPNNSSQSYSSSDTKVPTYPLDANTTMTPSTPGYRSGNVSSGNRQSTQIETIPLEPMSPSNGSPSNGSPGNGSPSNGSPNKLTSTNEYDAGTYRSSTSSSGSSYPSITTQTDSTRNETPSSFSTPANTSPAYTTPTYTTPAYTTPGTSTPTYSSPTYGSPTSSTSTYTSPGTGSSNYTTPGRTVEVGITSLDSGNVTDNTNSPMITYPTDNRPSSSNTLGAPVAGSVGNNSSANFTADPNAARTNAAPIRPGQLSRQTSPRLAFPDDRSMSGAKTPDAPTAGSTTNPGDRPRINSRSVIGRDNISSDSIINGYRQYEPPRPAPQKNAGSGNSSSTITDDEYVPIITLGDED